MNEPTIAYTLFALVLTGIACLIAGATIGWTIRQLQSQREISFLRSNIKKKRIELSDSHEGLEILKKQLGTLDKVVKTTKTKDTVIKDLLARQQQLNRDIDEGKTRIHEQSGSYLQLKKQLRQSQDQLNKSNVRLRSLAENQSSLKKKLQSVTKISADLAKQAALARAARQNSANKETRNSAVSDTTNARRITVTPASAKLPPAKSATELPKAVLQPTAATPVKTNSFEVGTVDPNNNRALTGSPVFKLVAQPVHGTGKQDNKTTIEAKPQSQWQKDDLKEIKGIGPAIETVLNKVGIECFEQLAALSKKEVVELDLKLGQYKGRMLRDNWVDSARQLKKQQSA